MKTNVKSILSILLISTLFIGCSVDDSSNNSSNVTISKQLTLGNTVTRNFSGKIVDQNNLPITSANVTLNGNSVLTNSYGEFNFNNVSVKENLAFIKVNKNGYINGSRSVFTHENTNHVVIMMLPAEITATIQSGQISNVTLPNSTKITFDGSFMTENGSSYSGEVNVIVNHLDAADPNVFVKMPGNLLGERTDGSISGMETYGMINVEMLGSNNEKIQIKNGHKATVTLPIAPNQLDTAPQQIPLWHFNESTGLWEEQGFSTRMGDKYVGEVSHFSWWNNDDAFVVGRLNVHVKNFDNTPVEGVRVTISRQAGSTGDVLMDLGFTGNGGNLSSPVPLNEELTFRAYHIDGSLIDERTLPASSQLVRNVIIIIPIQNRVANTTIKG